MRNSRSACAAPLPPPAKPLNLFASASKRNVNLDALRGVAILLVLGRHLDYFPLWTKMGWAGVDLFFVLSGFLISGLLFQEWQRRGAIDFLRFYIRRALKIYPAFYVLLLVTLLVHRIVPGIPSFPVTAKAILAECFFVQNYFPGLWPHTWSLAVEEHFYILLPIVLRLLYSRRREQADPFRALPTIFMIMATAEIVLRTATTWQLTTFVTEARYMEPSHLRIDGLLFGVLLSYYRHFQPEKLVELRRGPRCSDRRCAGITGVGTTQQSHHAYHRLHSGLLRLRPAVDPYGRRAAA